MKFPDRQVLGTVTVEAAGEFEIVMQRVGVAEARAPLDVERLARAMATESVRRWVMEAWVDSGVSEPGYATPDEMAAAIAREYAALEEPTP